MPSMHATLARRGYQLRGFENVLGYALSHAVSPATGDVHISVLDDRHRGRLVDLLVEAWRWPDVGGVGGDAIPPSEELRHWLSLAMDMPGYLSVAARIDGALVGGAAMRVDGAIAQFCGAATMPPFRRRGVQTALLRWRLAHAQTLGCSLAVVATQPASKSQQNVQREGFQLLYARQLLVKETSARVRSGQEPLSTSHGG
jgi:GNAT superfamily N-acetyltransferase